METFKSNSGAVSLKLLIDLEHNRVLFAEAGKDFVDFLFTLLSLPVNTIIMLLSLNDMVGSIAKLYESVENLDDTYLQPELNKDALLKPKSPFAGSNILKLANTVDSSNVRKKLYLCSSSSSRCRTSSYVTENLNEKCSSCSYASMNRLAIYVGNKSTTTLESSEYSGDAGYVKGVVTYMIMDDLEVKPMSTISSITMLDKFDIKDVGVLEEKVVELTMHEGVKLLKESLHSKCVLTNVFLRDWDPLEIPIFTSSSLYTEENEIAEVGKENESENEIYYAIEITEQVKYKSKKGRWSSDDEY